MQHPDFESFDSAFYRNRYSSPNHVNVVPFWPPVKHSKYHPGNEPMTLSCTKAEPAKLEITTSFPASIDVFEALAVLNETHLKDTFIALGYVTLHRSTHSKPDFFVAAT